MATVALLRPRGHTDERLDRHVAHLRDMIERFAMADGDAWRRVRDTALRTWNCRIEEAEQYADRVVFEGADPLDTERCGSWFDE